MIEKNISSFHPPEQNESNLIYPHQDKEKLVDQILTQHQSLRDQFNLPNPDFIFVSDDVADLESQRRDYFSQIVQVAHDNSISFVDNEQSKRFFQQHPDIGVFHLNSSPYVLLNRDKIGTHIDQHRVYNRVSYLVDLTMELTHALVSLSSLHTTQQEISQKSVLSICSPALLSSRFPQFDPQDFFSLSEKNLSLHQQISSINS